MAMSMTSFNVLVVFCARKQHDKKRALSRAFLLEMSTFPLHSLTHCWNLYAMSDAELLALTSGMESHAVSTFLQIQ